MNPYFVGALFIILGVNGLISKNNKSRISFFDDFMKYSESTRQIISFVSSIASIIIGVLIIVLVWVL